VQTNAIAILARPEPGLLKKEVGAIWFERLLQLTLSTFMVTCATTAVNPILKMTLQEMF
jgi:hypothetical protein